MVGDTIYLSQYASRFSSEKMASRWNGPIGLFMSWGMSASQGEVNVFDDDIFEILQNFEGLLYCYYLYEFMFNIVSAR